MAGQLNAREVIYKSINTLLFFFWAAQKPSSSVFDRTLKDGTKTLKQGNELINLTLKRKKGNWKWEMGNEKDIWWKWKIGNGKWEMRKISGGNGKLDMGNGK